MPKTSRIPNTDLCKRKKCKSGYRCRVVYRFKRVVSTVTRMRRKCPCTRVLVKPSASKKRAAMVDMAFVVDTTGSMGRVIKGIKTDIKKIVAANRGTIRSFVISPFNDPRVGPLTVSTRSSTIFKAVNRLRHNGGRDCPEMSMSGIMAAARRVKRGSIIYVFTDASAKDSRLKRAVS